MNVVANALIRHAEIVDGAPWIVRAGILPFVEWWGGLWVGGAVLVHEKGLEFRPNAQNRRLHVGSMRREVPRADVQHIQLCGRGPFGVIAVVHRGGELRLRVYRAQRTAEVLGELFGVEVRPGVATPRGRWFRRRVLLARLGCRALLLAAAFGAIYGVGELTAGDEENEALLWTWIAVNFVITANLIRSAVWWFKPTRESRPPDEMRSGPGRRR